MVWVPSFNTVHSVHCDHTHPYIPNTHTLFKIINHPYTRTNLHVPVINLHPQEDLIQRHIKATHSFYIQFQC
jgi:hypothetical protein